MHHTLLIAVFMLGFLIGVPVSALVVVIPAFLERQWRLDAAQMLGKESATEHQPRLSLTSLPEKITVRFTLTLLIMGLLSTWAELHYGVGASGLAALELAGGLLTLSLIDLDHQLLPDVLVLPLLWLGLIVNSFELFTTLSHALWGAVGGYLMLWVIRVISRSISGDHGIGQGDLKLFAMLGAWGGWQVLPVTLVLSSLAFALIGSMLLALGKIERTALIPFGPYLSAAGWFALLYTPAWASVWAPLSYNEYFTLPT